MNTSSLIIKLTREYKDELSSSEYKTLMKAAKIFQDLYD